MLSWSWSSLSYVFRAHARERSVMCPVMCRVPCRRAVGRVLVGGGPLPVACVCGRVAARRGRVLSPSLPRPARRPGRESLVFIGASEIAHGPPVAHGRCGEACMWPVSVVCVSDSPPVPVGRDQRPPRAAQLELRLVTEADRRGQEAPGRKTHLRTAFASPPQQGSSALFGLLRASSSFFNPTLPRAPILISGVLTLT